MGSGEYYQLSVRFTGGHIISITAMFLLISVATILNNFKPGLYLELSVSWRHRVAIPALVILFILTEHLLHFSCPGDSDYVKCKVARVRTVVMIPATLTSFLCQLSVIIDDIWGWRNLFKMLRRLFKPNSVAPSSSLNINIATIETPAPDVKCCTLSPPGISQYEVMMIMMMMMMMMMVMMMTCSAALYH